MHAVQCTGVKGISKMRRIRQKYIKIIWNDLPGRNAKAFANVVLSAKTNKIKKNFENHFVLVETYAGTVWVTIFINEIYCETTGDKIKQTNGH